MNITLRTNVRYVKIITEKLKLFSKRLVIIFFHNNCLYDYCIKNRGNIKCPVCRSDIGYACTDVAGFKEKFLGNPDGSPLFEGNKHILDIYDAQVQNQEGGKKRRTKRIRTKRIRTKRNRTKRNRNKRMRTKRHFRVKK